MEICVVNSHGNRNALFQPITEPLHATKAVDDLFQGLRPFGEGFRYSTLPRDHHEPEVGLRLHRHARRV